MIILSIETSCDETAISVIEAHGDFPNATYTILGNALFSQIDIHQEFGGVFPMLAKREHIKTILPMTEKALAESHFLKEGSHEISREKEEKLHELLHREEGLADALISFTQKHELPHIDLISVTSGPGLEPALWVGVNFAKALSYLWNAPVVPVNHMEGHVLASVFDGEKLPDVQFPALSLLISGGHTELVLMKDWRTYELIGQTRDDAVGEAFDKVARMLGLPYPGGPAIGKLANEAREENLPECIKLPKPMLNSGDCDFSFSGLKTAVRYAIQDKDLSENEKKAVARDFEDVVTEVLIKKTMRAIDHTGAHAVILGGGVSASEHIRKHFKEIFATERPDVTIYLPNPKLSTDNSIMIALAGHARMRDAMQHEDFANTIKADGNRSLTE